MTRSTAALGRFRVCSSKLTVANATVPSLLTWAAPAVVKGLATERTWGRAATSCSMRCTLAFTGASRTVPDVACTTIWSELPETAGKSFSSRFRAAPAVVLGSWNLVEKALPAARSTAKNPTKATSHRVRTILRWRKHHLARIFKSRLLGRGSREPPHRGRVRRRLGSPPGGDSDEVPGMSSTVGAWASSQDSATWAGVARRRLAVSWTAGACSTGFSGKNAAPSGKKGTQEARNAMRPIGAAMTNTVWTDWA